jgi:AcrR family transcriptional regulator
MLDSERTFDWILIVGRPEISPDAAVRIANRTEGYDRKLEFVLAAGARVMAREGYGMSTMRKVSREADMSLAGLYHYFASKEELLFLIQFHTFDSILERLTERLESVEDPKHRLRVMVTNHLEHFLSRMNELKVCASDMETLTGEYHEQVRTLRQRYLKTALEIVEAIAKEVGTSRVDPWLATLYLFGMLNWIYMWFPAAEDTSAETLANQVMVLFLEGFLPREPGQSKE